MSRDYPLYRSVCSKRVSVEQGSAGHVYVNFLQKEFLLYSHITGFCFLKKIVRWESMGEEVSFEMITPQYSINFWQKLELQTKKNRIM